MRNRLVSKARADRAEAITDRLFQLCESRRFQNSPKTETVEEFLRRGGKIIKVDDRRKSS